ncbi:MAG TPA: AraC family transcriptional regulator, partial [Erysipelothrix sp.]|nr:AraC family transcriptional regulator [Erysipelothrix sp.]
LLSEAIPQSVISNKRRTKSNLSKLQEIYDYIEMNYQKDLSLEDIAKHVSYNKHYLTRYFKSMTGMSVFTFLNDYRLNQAKWLLITTEKSMDDIAYEAGFQSTKRFHHVFKEVMGTSPLQYRKETKRGNEND